MNSNLKAKKLEGRIKSLVQERSELEKEVELARTALQEEKENSKVLEFKLAQSSNSKPDIQALRSEIRQLQIEKAELSLKYSQAKAIVQAKDNTELASKVSLFKQIESDCTGLERLRFLSASQNKELLEELDLAVAKENRHRQEVSRLTKILNENRGKLACSILKEKKIRAVAFISIVIDKRLRDTQQCTMELIRGKIHKDEVLVRRLIGHYTHKLKRLKSLGFYKFRKNCINHRNILKGLKIAYKIKARVTSDCVFDMKKKRMKTWKMKILLVRERETAIRRLNRIFRNKLRRTVKIWKSNTICMKHRAYSLEISKKFYEIRLFHVAIKAFKNNIQSKHRGITQIIGVIKRGNLRSAMNSLVSIWTHTQTSRLKKAYLKRILNPVYKELLMSFRAFAQNCTKFKTKEKEIQIGYIQTISNKKLKEAKYELAISYFHKMLANKKAHVLNQVLSYSQTVCRSLSLVFRKLRGSAKMIMKHYFTEWRRLVYMMDIEELCERHENLRCDKEALESHLEGVNEQVESYEGERCELYCKRFSRFFRHIVKKSIALSLRTWHTKASHISNKLKSSQFLADKLRLILHQRSFDMIMISAIRKQHLNDVETVISKRKTKNKEKMLVKVLKRWKYASRQSVICKKYINSSLKKKMYNFKKDSFETWKDSVADNKIKELANQELSLKLENCSLNRKMSEVSDLLEDEQSSLNIIEKLYYTKTLRNFYGICRRRSLDISKSYFSVWKSKLYKDALKKVCRILNRRYKILLMPCLKKIVGYSQTIFISSRMSSELRNQKTQYIYTKLSDKSYGLKHQSFVKWTNQTSNKITLVSAINRLLVIAHRQNLQKSFNHIANYARKAIQDTKNIQKARQYRKTSLLFKIHFIVLKWKQFSVENKRSKATLVKLFKRKCFYHKEQGFRLWTSYVESCKVSHLRRSWTSLNLEKGQMFKQMNYYNLMLEESKSIEKELVHKLRKSGQHKLSLSLVRSIKRTTAWAFNRWRSSIKVFRYNSPINMH